ncbi:unnamed protein product [Linum trigynum]|uniref:Uncharacterized protein n=1 Tax=Linum trigynum TaxID=586398 RepID=A0AAV2G111_9ROSI
MSRILNEDPDAYYMTPISDHDLKRYYRMNVGGDFITFDLHITVSSTHLGQTKYKAVIFAGVEVAEPDHQYDLASFMRL